MLSRCIRMAIWPTRRAKSTRRSVVSWDVPGAGIRPPTLAGHTGLREGGAGKVEEELGWLLGRAGVRHYVRNIGRPYRDVEVERREAIGSSGCLGKNRREERRGVGAEH